MSRPASTRTGRMPRAGLGLLIALLMLVALTGTPAAVSASGPAPEHHRSTVRILTVPATTTGGLLERLVTEFAEETGYEVELSTAGPDIFDRARAGEADVVLSHFGFIELQRFVQDRSGKWPTLILANTVVFIGPPDDPAGIGGTDDPVEAFRRIATSGSPFVVNDLGEVNYVVDTLWNQAGRPDKEGWYLDLGLRGPPAVRAAEQRNGYTAWGLHPFLNLQNSPNPVDMEPTVFDDSLMQRIIASVVVNPTRGRKVNVKGALALERFLTDPRIQARIRAFEMPDVPGPVFWQAGNNNDND